MRIAISVLLAIVVFGSATTVYLYRVRSTPVVFSWREDGDPTGEPHWSFFNPFRNKDVECFAETLLSFLKNRNFEQAFLRMTLPDDVKDRLLEQEREHPPLSWILVSRRDSAVGARLHYRVARTETERYTSPLWMTLERTADGYQVTDYESWY